MIARLNAFALILLCCGLPTFGARVHVLNSLAGSIVKVGPDGSLYVVSGGDVDPVVITRLSVDGTETVFQTPVTGAGYRPAGAPMGPTAYLLHTPIALAVGTDGSAFVAYQTDSGPSYERTAAVAKVSTTGQMIVTYFPPQPPADSLLLAAPPILDLTVDVSGNVLMTGMSQVTATAGSVSNASASGYMLKADSSLTKVFWIVSGYSGSHIATDPHGNVYVAGTANYAIPTSPGVLQGSSADLSCGDTPCSHQYVEAIDATGTKLLYATYVSGSGTDTLGGIAADADGDVWVAGSTTSADYPVSKDALETTYPGKQGIPAFQLPVICPK